MKILAIDNEGRTHASADSALVTRSQPWFVPDDGTPWQGDIYLAAIVSRLGKGVAPRFARRYYGHTAIVVHPRPTAPATPYEWTRDGAILAGEQSPTDTAAHTATITIGTDSYTADMDTLLHGIDTMLCDITAYHTVKTGDMLLIPIPGIPPIPLSRPLTTDILVDGTKAMRLKVR